MVGQFNERLASLVVRSLPSPGNACVVWAVGDRVAGRLQEAGLSTRSIFATPNAVAGITPLISQLLIALGKERENSRLDTVHLYHNQSRPRAAYEPVAERLLPLDLSWRRELEALIWPTQALPEIMAGGAAALSAFIQEFLFASLFRACAESLAAENARRFAAMQGAEVNIRNLLGDLTVRYNRQRQAAIDEELFDLVRGYEALCRQAESKTCQGKDGSVQRRSRISFSLPA